MTRETATTTTDEGVPAEALFQDADDELASSRRGSNPNEQHDNLFRALETEAEEPLSLEAACGFGHSEPVEVERRWRDALPTLLPTAGQLPPLSSELGECLPSIRRTAAALRRGERGRRNWPVVRGPGLFEVAVAPESQLRALCTLDRIVRHCCASGLTLVADESSGKAAHFLVQGQAMTLRLSESADREEVLVGKVRPSRVRADPELLRWKRDKYAYKSTGRLQLTVRPLGLNWVALSVRDAADAPLSSRIADVPMKLQQVALRLRLRDEVRQEVRRAAAALTAEGEMRDQLAQAAQARLARYEAMATSFERAERLRRLAAAMEARLDSQSRDVAEGVADLRATADRLDPTLGGFWESADGG